MSKYAYTNEAKTTVFDNDTGAFLPAFGGCGDEFYAFQAWLAAGNVPDAYVPPAPEPERFQKLDIIRAMRRLGTEAQLDALLSASPIFAKDWDAADHILLSDPVTQQALAQASIDVAAVIAEIHKGA